MGAWDLLRKKNPAFLPTVSPNHGQHSDGNTCKWHESSKPFTKKNLFPRHNVISTFAINEISATVVEGRDRLEQRISPIT